MDIFALIRDWAALVIGIVLTGMLGILWYDLREQRSRLSRYVKIDDCIEKRGLCGAMRNAMSNLVEAHSMSLQTMQDILRNQSECLARLDERVAALKEGLTKLYDEIKRYEKKYENNSVRPN